MQFVEIDLLARKRRTRMLELIWRELLSFPREVAFTAVHSAQRRVHTQRHLPWIMLPILVAVNRLIVGTCCCAVTNVFNDISYY